MRQSRMMSLVEAVANVVVGFVLAVATQLLVFPLLGLQASLGQNVRLTSAYRSSRGDVRRAARERAREIGRLSGSRCE